MNPTNYNFTLSKIMPTKLGPHYRCLSLISVLQIEHSVNSSTLIRVDCFILILFNVWQMESFLTIVDLILAIWFNSFYIRYSLSQPEFTIHPRPNYACNSHIFHLIGHSKWNCLVGTVWSIHGLCLITHCGTEHLSTPIGKHVKHSIDRPLHSKHMLLILAMVHNGHPESTTNTPQL